MAVNAICSAAAWGAPSYALKGSEASRDAYYSGHYTTVATWEGALPGTFSEDEIGEIIGLTADTGTTFFSGANTTSSYKAVLKAAEGEEADGTDAKGAQIATLLNLYDDANVFNIDIQGIEFHTGGSVNCNLGTSGSTVNITKSVFRDLSISAITIASAGSVAVNIGVCLFRNISGSFNMGVNYSDADVTCKILNCSFYDAYAGISQGVAALDTVKNNVSLDCSSQSYRGAPTMSYCASSDATATGTGSLTGLTTSEQWTDPAGDDFTVKDGADIKHAGISISGESWFPETDLAGNAWNSTPSMGCFEFAGSTILPILLTGSLGAASDVAGGISKIAGLVGGVQAGSDVSAEISKLLSLSGSFQAGAGVTGDLARLLNLSGGVQSDSQILGALSRTAGLTGDLQAGSDVSGQISRTLAMAGGLAAASEISNTLCITRGMAGNLNSVSNIDGALTILGSVSLSGDLSASSSITGSLSTIKKLSGLIDSGSDITGAITVEAAGKISLSGNISAMGAIQAGLDIKRGLVGRVEAAAGVDGGINLKVAMTGDADSVADLVGRLRVIGQSSLGIVIDPTITSITKKRILESVTIKRTIESV